MSDIAEFTLTLFNASTTAHILHLQTRSYATHMALGSFYEALPGLVDSVVEAYQGKYGLIERYPDVKTHSEAEPLEFIKWVQEYVQFCRKDLPQDTELQNMIDEIEALIDSTLYKLKFLS
jgi:hypothetical protein